MDDGSAGAGSGATLAPIVERSCTAEITHEALLRSWTRLRNWIETDREWLYVHQKLAEAAQRWDRDGQARF